MGRDREWLFKAIALAALVAAWAVAVRLWTGYPAVPKGETSLKMALLVVALAALGQFLIYLWRLWKAGQDSPIAAIQREFPAAALRFLPIVIGVAVISTFLVSISYLKSMITAIVPFWADAPFAAMDRAIFVDPQAIAIALGPVLPALGFFYGLWHVVHLGGILWVLHWKKGDKARHILSFMLTWSIGMALAYIFSSAGPIFTGTYDPAAAPESVQKPAAMLWANYQARGAVIGGGISAFPSMHVAIAAWFAIVLNDRRVPLIGIAYLIGVSVCSVILGWHYVIDSVAGIGVALFADRVSQAWLSRGQDRISVTAQLAAARN